MSIKVYDNLIPKKYLHEIQNYFLGGSAQWVYMPSMTYTESSPLESFGLSISLCNNGVFSNTYASTLVKGLLYLIQEKTDKEQILRSRMDMTFYNPNNYKHDIHTDLPENVNNITTIFYLNTSDGNTEIYDYDEKTILENISPIENRLLVFDGSLPHTGHSPSKNKNRVLINTNLI